MLMTSLSAEIIVFKNCKSEDYEFEKNEYKIDINKGVMTREFIYTDETYKRLRMNDMRIQKKTPLREVLRKKMEKLLLKFQVIQLFILR